MVNCKINGFILKRSSARSKGLVCLRFNNSKGPYPKEQIKALKRDWHFFYYSWWAVPLAMTPYHDLIDMFIVWDDLINEIRASGRTDCVIIRGGSETYEPHDKYFSPKLNVKRDIDMVHVARFADFKRNDIALKCVNFVKRYKPDCRAVFLEPIYSDLDVREMIKTQISSLGLESNVIIDSGDWSKVNDILNRSRISLFTSDEEGLCRSVIESLLAERPLLCYRGTRALTRLLYNDRYFNFYDEQTEESVGAAAWKLLRSGVKRNYGARKYILEERAMRFYDLAGWCAEVLTAAQALYDRDGQRLEPADIVSVDELSQNNRFWDNFELICD